jgi:hypothetical protein
MAELLITGCVRIAAAFYAARVFADVAEIGSLRIRRAFWTAGFVFFAVHVAAAFQFAHHWSHTAAWKATAEQTAEITGWESGAGLWANYAFTALWLADVTAWWCIGTRYPRRFHRIAIAVHVLFAFLWFNATAVFGSPFWRPVVAAFALSLATACVWRVRKG